MITPEQIQDLSKRKRINQDTILREYLQLLFLQNLYSEKLSQKIYFKGGTAIHLLLGSSRFSMDLDFTSEISTTCLGKLIKKIVDRMNLEIPDIKLKSSRKRINHSFSKILSYYPEGKKQPLNIALDFSLREKPVKKNQITVLKTDFPISGLPVISHLHWQEILAEKIRAILIRGKGRDLYDIYYLVMKNIAVDWEMVKEKMKIYPQVNIDKNVDALIRKIEKFEDKELTNDLAQFLLDSERNSLLPILKDELIKELEKEIKKKEQNMEKDLMSQT